MARSKQTRQPCTTNVNDSLDDCYNDAPEDILLSVIQIHTDTTKLLTITLFYTTGTIMLQGRACRRWVNHEFECHTVVVNAIDKLRPCSSNTMNDSNCLVSVSVSVSNGGVTATITAGTPTTCDNTDNTASVGSYDTVAAVMWHATNRTGTRILKVMKNTNRFIHLRTNFLPKDTFLLLQQKDFVIL